VKKAFRMSKLQWVNFCNEADLCKSLDNRTELFSECFDECNENTEAFLPPGSNIEGTYLVLCEWLEGLVRMARISYPSARGRTSECFTELVDSNLRRLMVNIELNQVESSRFAGAAMLPLLEPSFPLLRDIFDYFSSLEQSIDKDAETDTMNVVEFMRMMHCLDVADAQLNLQKAIEIFVACNQSEVDHFLGGAVDGYGLEERLQMEFDEFIDAILYCALLKRERLVANLGGKNVSAQDAIFNIVRQLRSGWKKWLAHLDLKRSLASRNARNEPQMLSLSVGTVEPLGAGNTRISVTSNAEKDGKH